GFISIVDSFKFLAEAVKNILYSFHATK
ncbi:MAG: hypothetical protein JWQ57_142, partial [Mucilaginibacter sp.]|nr:hypothetical protein [Mucilaginibacter sp.]